MWFDAPSPTSITPIASQELPAGRDLISCTSAGSAALLLATSAPPPTSTVPDGQLAVAVAVVFICGLLPVAVAVTTCVLSVAPVPGGP